MSFSNNPRFPHDRDQALLALQAVENTAGIMGMKFPSECGLFRNGDSLEATIIKDREHLNVQLFHDAEANVWLAIPRRGDRYDLTFLGSDDKPYRITRWSEGMPLPA